MAVTSAASSNSSNANTPYSVSQHQQDTAVTLPLASGQTPPSRHASSGGGGGGGGGGGYSGGESQHQRTHHPSQQQQQQHPQQQLYPYAGAQMAHQQQHPQQLQAMYMAAGAYGSTAGTSLPASPSVPVFGMQPQQHSAPYGTSGPSSGAVAPGSRAMPYAASHHSLSGGSGAVPSGVTPQGMLDAAAAAAGSGGISMDPQYMMATASAPMQQLTPAALAAAAAAAQQQQQQLYAGGSAAAGLSPMLPANMPIDYAAYYQQIMEGQAMMGGMPPPHPLAPHHPQMAAHPHAAPQQPFPMMLGMAPDMAAAAAAAAAMYAAGGHLPPMVDTSGTSVVPGLPGGNLDFLASSAPHVPGSRGISSGGGSGMVPGQYRGAPTGGVYSGSGLGHAMSRSSGGGGVRGTGGVSHMDPLAGLVERMGMAGGGVGGMGAAAGVGGGVYAPHRRSGAGGRRGESSGGGAGVSVGGGYMGMEQPYQTGYHPGASIAAYGHAVQAAQQQQQHAHPAQALVRSNVLLEEFKANKLRR